MPEKSVSNIHEQIAKGSGAVCWAIWKTPNVVCFGKKVIHHPTSVVFLLCSFLQYWAALATEGSEDEAGDRGWRDWTYASYDQAASTPPGESAAD
ncbi:hypothetical protein BRADI_1g56628v3 [Brachypodium distachyon]|uniref:Uncharacterized protein n=1 Tax=Brachypodium distachyon TaxID=15368 RepID=A0A2K2DRT2_BRADI|nr:hypothetical protein BRADI_1g56628v3 [Brachypodium distachyon]